MQHLSGQHWVRFAIPIRKQSWEIGDDPLIGRNYRESYNTKDQDPGRDARRAPIQNKREVNPGG